jgi:hypothetical protein
MAEGQQSPEEGRPGLGQKLAKMAKKHSSDAFYELDDPMDAAAFSVLVEMINNDRKEMTGSTLCTWVETKAANPMTISINQK